MNRKLRMSSSGAALINHSFMNGVLPAGYTFANASDNRSYFDASGVMKYAAANVPRFDYDPVTGAARGLLIEGQRANIFPNSTALSGSATNGTFTANAANSLDGTQNAGIFIPNATSGIHRFNTGGVTVTAGATYTVSIFVKDAGSRYYYHNFGVLGGGIGISVDLTNGAIIAGVNGTVTPYPNGWYRIAVTGVVSGTSLYGYPTVSGPSGGDYVFSGNGTDGLYMWGLQFEEGLGASSYIPTAGTAVTRAMDLLSTTSIPWFNPNEGTFLIETSHIALLAEAYPASFSDGTFNNMAQFYIQTSITSANIGSGGSLSYADGPAVTVNTILKQAMSMKAGSNNATVNGAFYTLGGGFTDRPVPLVTKLRLGNNFNDARPILGHIRSFKYWNKALPAATLQRITT